jgi:hypothetical protein
MAGKITIELPEEVLLDALRQLSPEQRRQLLEQLGEPSKIIVSSIPAAELRKWAGLISAGGDALAESEALYDS